MVASSSTSDNEDMMKQESASVSRIISVRDVSTSKETSNGLFSLLCKRKFQRALLAEAIGTGIIVFYGTGSVMSAVFTGELVGLFQIAAVWIIGVTLAIATTANISGAHLNPSISLAFCLLRPTPDFGWLQLVPYWIAQMVGAVTTSWFNYLMYANVIRAFEARENIDRAGPHPHAVASGKAFGEYYLDPVSLAQAFMVEAFGTAVLAFVVFSLTHPANDTMKHKVYIPPLIGMTVGGLISVLGTFDTSRV